MPSSCRIYLSLFQYRGTVPVRPRTRVTLTSLTGTLFAYVSPYVPPTASRQRWSATHLAESILTKVDYVTGGRCRRCLERKRRVVRFVVNQPAIAEFARHVGCAKASLLDICRVGVR